MMLRAAAIAAALTVFGGAAAAQKSGLIETPFTGYRIRKTSCGGASAAAARHPAPKSGPARRHHARRFRTVKDTRIIVVYGYARLMAYDAEFNLQPDILAGVDVERGHLHAEAAQGTSLVRRDAVHVGGFPVLVGEISPTTKNCRHWARRNRWW